MFYLLILLVLIGVVSVATTFVIDEPGYVMLQWGVWQVELSLVLGLLIVVLITLFLFVGLEVLSGVVRMPGRLGRSYREYREQKKYAASIKGLQHLLLGDWSKAEQLLDSSASYLPQPVISYLAAAYAAQKQGKLARRDKYLKKARGLESQYQELVTLISCRLQMEQGEHPAAIEELKKLCAKLPKNAQAFGMLAEAYETVEDWEALAQLIPHLQKSQARSAAELRDLSAKVARHRLRSARQSAELQRLWKSLSSPEQMNPELITAYVRKLFEFNRHKEVDKVIRHALDRRWNSNLVYLYGLIDGQMDDRRLYDTAAKWVQHHPKDSDLLLTAGRLARRVGLAGKAQAHLKKSIDLGGRRDAYEELGKLFEEQNRSEEAFRVYRAGIEAPARLDIASHSSDSAGYSESEENSKES